MSDLPPLRSLDDLIVEKGHKTSAAVDAALRIAAALQRQRRSDGTSKRVGVTRSALLLALLIADPKLEGVLADVGIVRRDLAHVLRVNDERPADRQFDLYLEPELVDAIQGYLELIPSPVVLRTADLAAATLISAEDGPPGQLSRRLSALGVDYPAAFRALRQIGVHGLANPRGMELPDVIETLGGAIGAAQWLGIVNSVECIAIVTSRPWQLDNDALVVSAAPTGGLGTLGAAVQESVRNVEWPSDDEFSSLSPDNPEVLNVFSSPDAPKLKQVIVASARDGERGTPYAAGRGAAAAVRTAKRNGVSSLAVPLLGAGALGLPLDKMAEVNVRAVIEALGQGLPSSLQRVIFVGVDQHTIDAVRTAWNAVQSDDSNDVDVDVDVDADADADAESRQIANATLLAGGMSRDLVNGDEKIPLEDDHLGIGTYVAMLAALIAQRETPMPLSIGLFGEWGSGKSYFMGLLRGQIHKLAHSGDEAYVREVVSITFNAWHYSDTNLWASLGNEIFEQLAGPRATPAKHREALREDLAAALRRTEELEHANEQATEETARLRQKLEQAQQEAAGSAKTLFVSVTKSKTLGRMLRDVWGKLGVRDEADKVQLLSDEVRGTSEEFSALKVATSGTKGVCAAAAMVFALALIAASTLFQEEAANWVAGGGLVTLATVLGTTTVAVQRARKGLRSLQTVADEIRQQAEDATDKAVARELQQLRQADAREAVLQSQLRETLQRAGELRLELAALSPGQRWFDFVSERAGSEDYSSKLGLISTIRRDFERLIQLMKEWRALDEPEQHRPIDRIVLYIDDLDRCSPRQVVDVLQAVHLLLALDLFVVVVGVDPRWLLHSLREQYASVFPDQVDGTPDAMDRADADADWRTTPQDYLEKIFNIPFVLPGMTGSSFGRLIRELSGMTDEQDSGDRAQSGIRGTESSPLISDSSSPKSPDASLTDPGVDLPVERGSEVATALGVSPKPAAQRLTEDELEILSALGPLVRSPRQAKRLLNLYRLVRSTRDLSPAADFLGGRAAAGEFQAVAVLLGLLTTYPRLLGQLLSAPPSRHGPGGLSFRPQTQTWQEVVDGLRPRVSVGGWSNDISVDLSDSERHEWNDLVQRVRPATALVTLPDLSAFQLWGPRVTRFSFVLSPLAVQNISTPG